MIDNETDIVYVDNTILRAVARCDTEATLRHVLDLTTPGDAYALDSGTAAHEALASYLEGRPADYCNSQYRLLWQPLSDKDHLDLPEHPWHRLSYANTSKIMAEWFITHPLTSLPFVVNPKLVEVGFSIPLSDECVCGRKPWNGMPCCDDYRPAFVFYGRLDAIVQGAHDRALYVLDHKTTGRITPYWTEKFRNDSQMTGYVWAAQRTLGQTITGVFINAIEFSKLPDSNRKCGAPHYHGVPYSECGIHHMKSELLIYTRSPDQLDQWQSDALKLARRYKVLAQATSKIEGIGNVAMQGTYHGACGFCDFKDFCGGNRPLHYAKSMLIHRPWRPHSGIGGTK